MANIICPVHKFPHLSSQNTTVTGISSSYNYSFIKFTIEGLIRYGALRSYINTNLSGYQYSFEMAEACPDGFNKANHYIFSCEDRRGVIMALPTTCLLTTGVHDTLRTLSYKMVDPDSICCILQAASCVSYPNIVIGAKCHLDEMPFENSIGIFKWFGKINTMECIGIEMRCWISSECNGYCKGLKIFDCQDGHGIIIKVTDLKLKTADPTELEFHDSGLVDLTKVYYVEKICDKSKDLINVGRRVKLLMKLCEKYGTRHVYGIIKWVGKLNKGNCVGIELDYPCENAMDGIISTSERFGCEPGYGVVCPVRSVIFDYHIYSVDFTVNESFNIDFEIIHIEDWNQSIVKEKDLKRNKNVYVHIEKNKRIFNTNGLLKWCGYIQGISVGILEMNDDFPITRQQKITSILKDVKNLAYIIVDLQYLFKYKSIKPFKKFGDGVAGYDIGTMTKFGLVKWQGVDENNNLHYGFEMESSLDYGTDGTFFGQRLFECSDGFGILVSAQILRDNSSSVIIDKSQKPKDSPGVSNTTTDDWLDLLTTVANDYGISSDQLLTSAMKMDNVSIIGPLLNNITSTINIYKYPKIINQLLESQSFDILETSLVKCDIDADNNKQLLRVAAVSLKYGNTKLFEGCMNKCSNKDTLMDNGETFLTYIIKEKIDQSSIIEAIEAYTFNIIKANNDGCIPLTLACTNMMMDVVDCIVKYIKNQEINSKSQVCSICMDRSVKTVFNCGHNSCKECSDNITQCHICKENIVSRGLLYLG